MCVRNSPLFQAWKIIYRYAFSCSNIQIYEVFRPTCMNDKISFTRVRKFTKIVNSIFEKVTYICSGETMGYILNMN